MLQPPSNRSPRKFITRLVRPLLQVPGIAGVVLKRQRHYLGLTLLALVNVILAVGLITNASFFSQAVDRVVLLQELRDFSSVTGRPPFSTSIYVFPSNRSPLTLPNAEALSRHIGDTLSGEVGLPLRHMGMEIASGSMILQPSQDSDLFVEGKTNLGTVNITYLSGVSEQMQIVEGAPLDEGGISQGHVDVWMHESLAQSMGANIGETLDIGRTMSGAKTSLRLAGIWRAADPKSYVWFTNPDSEYSGSLLVRSADYTASIQPMMSAGASKASWYVILDEQALVPKNSQQYLEGFERAGLLIEKFLPGARMNTPPLDPLSKFVDRSSALTVLLMGYNLPAYAILLYFLVLTAAIMAQWQRRETVMLVGRGMSVTGVLSLTTIEQMILFVIGYPVGTFIGMLIARLMGYTASFLTFTGREPLPVSLEGINLPLTLLAFSFALFSRLLPAYRAARSSLVTEERERARPMNKPFWYRFYLDVLLLLPTYYAYDQMVKRGSLAGLVTDKPEDLFRDPLLVVVPALFILTASLVTMRIFALLMRLIDLAAGAIPWLTLHLALRQLGRQSLDYIRPLLLVIIALAMGVYTLSMAASLDQWMVDRVYYRTGVDYAFTPLPGENAAEMPDGGWVPLPYTFLSVPGVEAVTRVGAFDMRLNPNTGAEIRGRFLGIDRAEFASSAWFRDDFAAESLGAMMNRLAAGQEAVLVSEDLLSERGYQVGDIFTMRVDLEQIMSTSAEYIIVGTYRHFPTVYEDKVTVIGNLDHLSTLSGVVPPHDLWMRLQPGVDAGNLKQAILENTRVTAGSIRDTSALIRTEQERMERVGIFGTLTVGFLATALMAILGLLVYSYASLQERAYRLAILNAVGLSRRQILIQVVLEYTFLALFGVLAGALIGLVASNLFVPFFRYTGETGVPLPPLLPVISGERLGNLSILFGLSIILVEVISMASILHNRLVQIMKRVWI